MAPKALRSVGLLDLDIHGTALAGPRPGLRTPLDTVRSMMAETVETLPPFPEMCRHDLASQGKDFRSSLCLDLCQALGADPKDSLPAAVCLELVHRTSLVFDDIQDRTPERNSQPALWAKYGVDQALNAGLTLSACARLALTELTGPSLPEGCSIRILRVLEESVVGLSWGQYLDLGYQIGNPPGKEEYLGMVSAKTGTLVGPPPIPDTSSWSTSPGYLVLDQARRPPGLPGYGAPRDRHPGGCLLPGGGQRGWHDAPPPCLRRAAGFQFHFQDDYLERS